MAGPDDAADAEPPTLGEIARAKLEELKRQASQPRARVVLQASLLACLLFILLLIFLLGAQLRFETLASESFRKREYEVAAGRFLRAYQLSTMFGKDRNLYQVGLCYYNMREFERASDFFMKLFREFGESDWHEAARAHWENVLHEMVGKVKGGSPTRGPQTPLSKSFTEMRQRQAVLVDEIRNVHGGDVKRLERYYEEYKASWEAYNLEWKKAYQDAKERGPAFEIEAPRKGAEASPSAAAPAPAPDRPNASPQSSPSR